MSNIEAIIQEESRGSTTSAQQAWLMVSRAAHRGHRLGVEEARAEQATSLAASAEAAGVQICPPEKPLRIPGRLFEDGESSAAPDLNVPIALQRQIERLHLTPEHMHPGLAIWSALNTADYVGQNGPADLTDIWAELRRRKLEQEDPLPETMRPDEFGALSGAILTAQYLTEKFYLEGEQ